MLRIGETLRRTRESKGISLEQAEEDTKIRRLYLEALENENYDIIPGMVYTKGFLKNYGFYLGVNVDELMIAFKLATSPSKESRETTDANEESHNKFQAKVQTKLEEKQEIRKTITRRRYVRKQNKKLYRLTVIVAMLAIVTYGVYSFVAKNTDKSNINGQMAQQTPKSQTTQPQNKTTQPNNQTGQLPEGTIDQGAKAPTGTEQTGQTGQTGQVTQTDSTIQVTGAIRLALSTSNQESWVKVTSDGKTVFAGTLAPGSTKEFSGTSKMKFRIGSAGAINVVVNGKDLGSLGAVGQVVDREIITNP